MTKKPPTKKTAEKQKPAVQEAAKSDAGRKKTPIAKFPIVGIGASAGGLEALELFLKNVPAQSGMAFVIIQHLDPRHESAMAPLLQKATPMPVKEITDRLRVEPDHVYITPPNADVSILNGVLHLLAPTSPQGLRLPIDSFFRCLADDRQDAAIGVILSGMGSDGVLGIRAIKEKAGVVLVQKDPKFDGMPRSAIDSGLADVIAPAVELPLRILDCLQHWQHLQPEDGLPLNTTDSSSIEKIIILLRSQTKQDFSLYKTNTIYRRIERRMGLHKINRIADYVQYLQKNPQEATLLFKELLIGVTSFFRDPEEWDHLRDEALQALFAARPKGGDLRAWVPACSTGEEAYSLAMVFREALEQLQPGKKFTLQIFATDIDRDAIDKARRSLYPANIAADISDERLRRFFVKTDSGYRISAHIREMVMFAPQNIIQDTPFSKIDILTCRNLLIYLSQQLQKKIFSLFHYSLNPDGILMLGSAESAGTAADLFLQLAGKSHLYRRLKTDTPVRRLDFIPTKALTDAAGTAPQAQKPVANLQSLADQLLLNAYSPAAVLTSEQGDILYVNGRTGAYLEPAAGKANWNIFAMAREELRAALGEAFHRALRSKTSVTLNNAQVSAVGVPHTIDITVHPVSEPLALRGMMLVVFKNVPARHEPKDKCGSRVPPEYETRKEALERELRHAREELQKTREQMLITNEELTSSKEQMQLTNEELQSTNEELTTSNEEMQSMNEELHTMNQELQAKLEELSGANSDLKNLLDSTDIATLFLDSALGIRRFTVSAAKIINLIPGDAGRPITDIASDLLYPELADNVHDVLRTLIYQEKTVATRDGRWFRVRITPYRSIENVIEGVVITFSDITASTVLEAQLREAQAGLEKQVSQQSADLEQAHRDLKGREDTNPAGTDTYYSSQNMEKTPVKPE